MKLKILCAKETYKLLKKLFSKHEKIYVASAWGTNGTLADKLFQEHNKFESVTFGVSFCQTDPDLIDRMIGKKNTFIAESKSGTFHPKAYYFRSGDKAEAIIGSSNFTMGGLQSNLETNIHIKGRDKDNVFQDIRSTIENYNINRKPITKVIAKDYRIQHEAMKKLKKPTNPILSNNEPNYRHISSKLAHMEWEEYVSAVKSEKLEIHKKRLALIRKCQEMFASVSSLDNLNSKEWKAIAGLIGEKQKINSNLSQHDWGWFGSMKGMGDFANRISEKDKYISKALDSIPRHGDITKEQYDEFCKNFLSSFKNSVRTGSYPTATRLLAMKRPDFFVCINKPNLYGLSQALNFPKTTLKLNNYWEKVIEPIQLSPWFNSKRPNNELSELWDSRVAMLDAIYYNAN